MTDGTALSGRQPLAVLTRDLHDAEQRDGMFDGSGRWFPNLAITLFEVRADLQLALLHASSGDVAGAAPPLRDALRIRSDEPAVGRALQLVERGDPTVARRSRSWPRCTDARGGDLVAQVSPAVSASTASRACGVARLDEPQGGAVRGDVGPHADRVGELDGRGLQIACVRGDLGEHDVGTHLEHRHRAVREACPDVAASQPSACCAACNAAKLSATVPRRLICGSFVSSATSPSTRAGPQPWTRPIADMSV